ncbi:bZIP transcription factor 23-like [Typha latifolia]|uniref:bZIP transcription factor 23-like n=1 Tax=Typha latifolia TaxID=4733 RepID=UPI003C2C0D1A
MEEVWKDIITSRGSILQDLLTGAFKAAAPPPPPPPISSSFALPLTPQIPHISLSPGRHKSSCHLNGRKSFSICGRAEGRNKRMIKNRESAARSRARKQAYTNELELEATQLLEENSKLKKEYEELRMEMAAQLPIKRKLLQRTLSAPN